jgi:hypothetical protein
MYEVRRGIGMNGGGRSIGVDMNEEEKQQE